MTINRRFSRWYRWRQPPGLRLTAFPLAALFAGTAFMFSFYRRLPGSTGGGLKVIRILLLFKQGTVS